MVKEPREPVGPVDGNFELKKIDNPINEHKIKKTNVKCIYRPSVIHLSIPTMIYRDIRNFPGMFTNVD